MSESDTPRRQEVLALISKFAGVPVARLKDSDKLADLGLTGDDADELMNSFFATFAVDPTGYSFMDYFDVEGFIPFPSQVSNRIPISIADLIQAADRRSWIASTQPPARTHMNLIQAAFANMPAPGNAFDDISATKQDEGIVEYFRGTTWHGHTVASLRHHCAALSFFAGPAFRYWLPAFMLASIEDPEAADVIPSHILYDLEKQERMTLFTTAELKAIASFLLYFGNLYDNEQFRDAAQRLYRAAG